jgi:RluA family pseudouridine synthase
MIPHILYEDENYLAADKPAGIPIHATLDPQRVNFFHEVYHFIEQRERTEAIELFLIHRLDKDTSGVVLFAKNKKSAQILEKIFKERKIEKTYLAMVEGKLTSSQGVFSDFLKKKKIGKKEKVVVVKSGGQKAISEYTVLAEKNHRSLVGLNIRTGRMHQLRVQLAHRGHPVIGDKDYGPSVADGQRMLLHARMISFTDPQSAKVIKVESPMPREIAVFLESLGH